MNIDDIIDLWCRAHAGRISWGWVSGKMSEWLFDGKVKFANREQRTDFNLLAAIAWSHANQR